MYKLLKVNGVDFITPNKGTFSVKKDDKVNEYETENGGKVLEVVREGVLSGTMAYRGLFASQIAQYDALLTTVSTLTIYDPMKADAVTITARILNKAAQKIVHNDNVSAWSFSFDFEEL